MHSLRHGAWLVGVAFSLNLGACSDRGGLQELGLDAGKGAVRSPEIAVKSGEEMHRSFSRLTGVMVKDADYANLSELLPSGNDLGTVGPIHYRNAQRLAALYCEKSVNSSFPDTGTPPPSDQLPRALWGGVELGQPLGAVLAPEHSENRRILVASLFNKFLGPTTLSIFPERSALEGDALVFLAEAFPMYCPGGAAQCSVPNPGNRQSTRRLSAALCTAILGSLSVIQL